MDTINPQKSPNEPIHMLTENGSDLQLDSMANNHHSTNNHCSTKVTDGETLCKQNSTLSKDNAPNGSVTMGAEPVLQDNLVDIHSIILDLSGVSFVDIVGINTIKSIITDFQKIGVKVLLAQCRGKR